VRQDREIRREDRWHLYRANINQAFFLEPLSHRGVYDDVERHTPLLGGGAESIGEHKRRRIVAAARQYLTRVRPEPPCRFDVVTLDRGAPEWLRGAFDAGVEG